MRKEKKHSYSSLKDADKCEVVLFLSLAVGKMFRSPTNICIYHIEGSFLQLTVVEVNI